MSPEKWQSVKAQIQDAFKQVEITSEELELPERGKAEVLEFDGPLGRMRIEYWTKPVVLGKNVSGSRRAGSHHEVDYVYSETETMHQLKAYKYDDAEFEWTEIDLKNSFNL
jgi:hypothetical protein